MFETETEARTFAEANEIVEYCEVCKAWTIIDAHGYLTCLCE